MAKDKPDQPDFSIPVEYQSLATGNEDRLIRDAWEAPTTDLAERLKGIRQLAEQEVQNHGQR